MHAQAQSREALLESLNEILREALEFSRQAALEAAGPGAEELALILCGVEICFVTSLALAVNIGGRAPTIHDRGIDHRIFAAQFRTIPKQRHYLRRKRLRILDCLFHDKRCECFIWRQSA